MAYFDIDDTQPTPDSEAENRRRVLAAIASSGKPAVLGQPARVQPAQPGTREYDLSVNATNQPNVPAPRLTPTEAPTLGPTSMFGNKPPTLGTPPILPGRPNVMPTREDFPAKPVPTWQKVLGIAAAPFLPNLTTNILGRPQREAERAYQGAVQDYTRPLGIARTQAETREMNARAANLENPPAPQKEEDWSILPGVTGPDGQLIQQEKNSGQVRYVSGVLGQKKTAETQEQNKLAFQSVIGKIDAAGLPTDPKNLPNSLNQAVRRGAIKPEEHQAAAAYLAANPTPSTTVQVQTVGAQTREDIKDANTYYRWTDASGKIVTGKGGKVPKGADAEPIGNDKDFAQHKREANTANLVQQSLNRISQDVDEHPELFDNAGARAILATTLEQIDRQSAGILVAGTGGSIPLPSGLGDMINTGLQNRALDPKTAAAVKQYIADYKSMKDKVIVQQMEMQGGKIGRGSHEAFKAIADQIPNGATPDSTTARRQVSNLQQTQAGLMRQYADNGKEQPYNMKAGGPQGDTVNVISPDGTPGTIPRANLQKALKQGYRQP